eukprot:scaffold647567_cov17-Prasinocladus_malaysianus.AAC.1
MPLIDCTQLQVYIVWQPRHRASQLLTVEAVEHAAIAGWWTGERVCNPQATPETQYFRPKACQPTVTE